MPALTVVLGDHPYTRELKERADWSFPQITPLYSAFARMVRNLEFDVCEMALATYLQAREAGVPITLLPVVLVSGTHHASLTRLPGGPPLTPRDLVGRRVGVRSYSQTTGLWVRGILREEFGVEASDVTWVTTEEPHVRQYREPTYVRRSSAERVLDLLLDGEAEAAVLGPKAIGNQGEGLVPVIPDAEAAAGAWVDRHGFVPVNHMLVVRDDVLRSDPEAVAGLGAAGWTDPLVECLQVAGRYALEQGLIHTPLDVEGITR